jgi:hypothetical protein
MGWLSRGDTPVGCGVGVAFERIVCGVWASPAFSGQLIRVISCCVLSVQVLVVDLLWGSIAESRVETLSIIVELDVSGHVLSCVFPGRIDGSVNSLHLHP